MDITVDINKDNLYKYSHKNVFDIKVGNSFVRVWNRKGTSNSNVIKKSFMPLLKTTFVFPYVALMPDFHPGKDAMIGSVIPTREVLLPTVIGNDIGCGMTAVRLPVFFESVKPHLQNLRQMLLKRIPTGSTYNSTVTDRVENNHVFKAKGKVSFISGRNRNKIIRQFGSLGSGNHFLEIQTDTEGKVWVMLHSGSRYLGVLVREYYVKAGISQSGIDQQLYSKIPYLKTNSKLASSYLDDLKYTNDFATESRKEMLLRALEAFSILKLDIDNTNMRKLITDAIDTTHNCISLETHFNSDLYIHRKGAIRVNKGEIGIIPGSMGTHSYIVEGKGNGFSFCSCSHGAGRIMSRSQAFRNISDKEVCQSMKGIVYDNHLNIKDEAPAAYKDIDSVMRGQKDIVKITYKLKPVISIKGN